MNPYYRGGGIASGLIDGLMGGYFESNDRAAKSLQNQSELESAAILRALHEQQIAQSQAQEQRIIEENARRLKAEQDAKLALGDFQSRLAPQPYFTEMGPPQTGQSYLQPTPLGTQAFDSVMGATPLMTSPKSPMGVEGDLMREGLMTGAIPSFNPAYQQKGADILTVMEQQRGLPASMLSPLEQASFISRGIPKEAVVAASIPKDEPPTLKDLLNGKFTPQSVEAARRAKDWGLLELAEKSVPEMYGTANAGDSIIIYNKRTGDIKSKEKVGVSPSAVFKIDNKPPATDKTDPIVAREAVKDLPKLRRDANFALNASARMDMMIGLLDKGQAGGLSGEIKAFFAPILGDVVSEADLYKRLSKANAGSLRQAVVGGGQVSNYENKLLQTIGGGGAGARAATKELLKFYKSEHMRTVNNYNDAAEAAALVAPSVAKAFPKIGGAPKGSPDIQTARKLLQKYGSKQAAQAAWANGER